MEITAEIMFMNCPTVTIVPSAGGKNTSTGLNMCVSSNTGLLRYMVQIFLLSG